MALPDYLKFEQGTAIQWSDTGTSGQTKSFTFASLANATGWMGQSADLGATVDEEYVLTARIQTGGTPPTGGGSAYAEFYLAGSTDGTNFPGKVTGSTAAYPTTVANNKLQLGAPVVVLVATGDTSTTLEQNGVIWVPPARYVAPVVINLTAQTLSTNTTTNTGCLIATPRRLFVQDTA